MQNPKPLLLYSIQKVYRGLCPTFFNTVLTYMYTNMYKYKLPSSSPNLDKKLELGRVPKPTLNTKYLSGDDGETAGL